MNGIASESPRKRYQNVWSNSDEPSIQDLDTGEILPLDTLGPKAKLDNEPTEEEEAKP